jgi:hypothetical protein
VPLLRTPPAKPATFKANTGGRAPAGILRFIFRSQTFHHFIHRTATPSHRGDNFASARSQSRINSRRARRQRRRSQSFVPERRATFARRVRRRKPTRTEAKASLKTSLETSLPKCLSRLTCSRAARTLACTSGALGRMPKLWRERRALPNLARTDSHRANPL